MASFAFGVSSDGTVASTFGGRFPGFAALRYTLQNTDNQLIVARIFSCRPKILLARVCTHCGDHEASDLSYPGGLGSWRNYFG